MISFKQFLAEQVDYNTPKLMQSPPALGLAEFIGNTEDYPSHIAKTIPPAVVGEPQPWLPALEYQNKWDQAWNQSQLTTFGSVRGAPGVGDEVYRIEKLAASDPEAAMQHLRDRAAKRPGAGDKRTGQNIDGMVETIRNNPAQMEPGTAVQIDGQLFFTDGRTRAMGFAIAGALDEYPVRVIKWSSKSSKD